ncbi:hypothetical protein SKAU_G00318620 [Synaphobranchus kaupii]|uniref:Uncharacterized protein n=1 Tax=Synaphobranchus kaupii TaxID=118154 RepID=A0A9Q1ILS4_SYNKA|nr:hypothetical protein SKAU_G00318620 [Synaphobranchus kaupii]
MRMRCTWGWFGVRGGSEFRARQERRRGQLRDLSRCQRDREEKSVPLRLILGRSVDSLAHVCGRSRQQAGSRQCDAASLSRRAAAFLLMWLLPLQPRQTPDAVPASCLPRQRLRDGRRSAPCFHNSSSASASHSCSCRGPHGLLKKAINQSGHLIQAGN